MMLEKIAFTPSRSRSTKVLFGQSQYSVSRLAQVTDFGDPMPRGLKLRRYEKQVERMANARGITFDEQGLIPLDQARSIIYPKRFWDPQPEDQLLRPREEYYLGQIVDGIDGSNRDGWISKTELACLFYHLDQAGNRDHQVSLEELGQGKIFANRQYLFSEGRRVELPSDVQAHLRNILATNTYTASSSERGNHCDLMMKNSDRKTAEIKADIAAENIDGLKDGMDGHQADVDKAEYQTFLWFVNSRNMPYFESFRDHYLSLKQNLLKPVKSEQSGKQVYQRIIRDVMIHLTQPDPQENLRVIDSMGSTFSLKSPDSYPSSPCKHIPLVDSVIGKIDKLFEDSNIALYFESLFSKMEGLFSSPDALQLALTFFVNRVALGVYQLKQPLQFKVVHGQEYGMGLDTQAMYVDKSGMDTIYINFDALQLLSQEAALRRLEALNSKPGNTQIFQDKTFQIEVFADLIDSIFHELMHAYSDQLCRDKETSSCPEDDLRVQDYDLTDIYNVADNARAVHGNIDYYSEQPYEKDAFTIGEYAAEAFETMMKNHFGLLKQNSWLQYLPFGSG